MADRAERGDFGEPLDVLRAVRNSGTGHGFPGFACHACYAGYASCASSPPPSLGGYGGTSQPNGFPSPPRVSFPRWVVRFAKCGPPSEGGEGEVPPGGLGAKERAGVKGDGGIEIVRADSRQAATHGRAWRRSAHRGRCGDARVASRAKQGKGLEFRIFHDNSAYSRTRVIAPNVATARGWSEMVLLDEKSTNWKEYLGDPHVGLIEDNRATLPPGALTPHRRAVGKVGKVGNVGLFSPPWELTRDPTSLPERIPAWRRGWWWIPVSCAIRLVATGCFRHSYPRSTRTRKHSNYSE